MKKKDSYELPNEVASMYQRGKLSRREFVRLSSILGLCGGVAATTGGLFFPQPALAAMPRRGGEIKISLPVLRVTHPSQATWTPVSCITAPVAEYLTRVHGDGSVSGILLESWKPSTDLKTWTLNVRRGVTFNNGDAFTADDVIFTIKQWLDPAIQSSMINYLGPYLSSTDIEKTGSHQLKLHLKKARFALPVHLAEFAANILNHRTFEGDFIKAPHGTGPFTIETYRPGEVCIYKARPDYWAKGVDGKPLPYLDSIKFIDMGYDVTPKIAALKDGEINLIGLGGQEIMQAFKNDSRFISRSIETADTGVLRMRTDLKPWSDERVRLAFKNCQHREKILALAVENMGLLGHDAHIFPKHPAYCKKPIPPYDPEKSRALLNQAGYPNGLEVTLNYHADTYDHVRYAKVLKEDCLAGGFKVTLNPTPEYWDKWTEYDLGITQWIHNPIATTYLNVGYGVDQQGKPLPWNETRWVDSEFQQLLEQARGILDADERRKVMCKLEDVMAQRGGIGISYWTNKWWVIPENVHDIRIRADYLFELEKAWLS